MFARTFVNVDREYSQDAITIINDLFGNNSNYLIFMLNYIWLKKRRQKRLWQKIYQKEKIREEIL